METLYKDGETATILTTKFPIIGSDGNVEGVGGINLDITERKEIERMKHEFISIASHELRTPLTSLKGALGLVHSDVVGQIPEAMAPLLEIAHRNSERLGRLIDDILDVEKLDAEKMEFSMQPIPIPALIGQAISEHVGFGIEHGVSFVIDGDVPNVAVLGDEDRLMQVFSNLMSNAAKFSAEGTVVRLSACEKGQGVRISITDEGQGIPEVFHDNVFEKFTRADNSDSGLQYGTGLGLSIAKVLSNGTAETLVSKQKPMSEQPSCLICPRRTNNQTPKRPRIARPTLTFCSCARGRVRKSPLFRPTNFSNKNAEPNKVQRVCGVGQRVAECLGRRG